MIAPLWGGGVFKVRETAGNAGCRQNTALIAASATKPHTWQLFAALSPNGASSATRVDDPATEVARPRQRRFPAIGVPMKGYRLQASHIPCDIRLASVESSRRSCKTIASHARPGSRE